MLLNESLKQMNNIINERESIVKCLSKEFVSLDDVKLQLDRKIQELFEVGKVLEESQHSVSKLNKELFDIKMVATAARDEIESVRRHNDRLVNQMNRLNKQKKTCGSSNPPKRS